MLQIFFWLLFSSSHKISSSFHHQQRERESERGTSSMMMMQIKLFIIIHLLVFLISLITLFIITRKRWAMWSESERRKKTNFSSFFPSFFIVKYWNVRSFSPLFVECNVERSSSIQHNVLTLLLWDFPYNFLLFFMHKYLSLSLSVITKINM